MAGDLPRILDWVNATNAGLRATWHAPERRNIAYEREPDDGRLRPHFDDAAKRRVVCCIRRLVLLLQMVKMWRGFHVVCCCFEYANAGSRTQVVVYWSQVLSLAFV